MDEELYKKVRNELYNANRKALKYQNYLTGAMALGCTVSLLLSVTVPELADICHSLILCFSTATFTGSSMSLLKRYYIDKEAKDFAIRVAENQQAQKAKEEVAEKVVVLTNVFKEEKVEPLKEAEYPDIYFKAAALKDYIASAGFEGSEGFVHLLESLMGQLQKPLDADWLEAYENVITKIANSAYNKALKLYNLPYEEAIEYDLKDLVLKAKVLEGYITDIAYPGYEDDLKFLYEAVSESKMGAITPENFNQWIHYIAGKAYQSTLNEGVTR